MDTQTSVLRHFTDNVSGRLDKVLEHIAEEETRTQEMQTVVKGLQAKLQQNERQSFWRMIFEITLLILIAVMFVSPTWLQQWMPS